ncbi:MAG: TlyA family RNA methyltransferase [Peptococcia bacterium]
MKKERLDQALVNRGLVPSREKGKALIMAGKVFVNEQKVDKAGTAVKPSDQIMVKGDPLPYVSRGGLKLEKALKVFPLDLKGKVMMDIGASTGGFTHCALKHGIERVYAVDVGYGQLDWSLRQNPQVINLERTNARYLSSDVIKEPIDFISIDVSFISLAKILPSLIPFLQEQGDIIALVKPQFEAGRENVEKKGVVKSAAVHQEVISQVLTSCRELGLYPHGLDFSPITGPEGNIEFLLWLRKEERAELAFQEEEIAALVSKAHRELIGN